MYWKIYYTSTEGFHRDLRFESEEALDAWLKKQQNPGADKDDSIPLWKNAEQGGEIARLEEVYTFREKEDLYGVNIHLYKTPVPSNELAAFTVTHIDYCKDSFRKYPDMVIVYEIYGKPTGKPDSEEILVAAVEKFNLGRLLADDMIEGKICALLTSTWAVPSEQALPDERPDHIILRSAWQLTNYELAKTVEQQINTIRTDAQRLPFRPLVYKCEDKYTRTILYPDNKKAWAYIIHPYDNTEARDPKKRFYIRPDHFDEDLADFRKYVDNLNGGAIPTPAKPPTPKPLAYQQLSLF